MSMPLREKLGNCNEDEEKDEGGDSYRDKSREAIVDFPDPERPTIAVQELSGISMEIFRRTGASGRDG
jgi:hypothetical protein